MAESNEEKQKSSEDRKPSEFERFKALAASLLTRRKPFSVNEYVWVVSKHLPADEHGRPISRPGMVVEVLPDRLRVSQISSSSLSEFTRDGDGLGASNHYYLTHGGRHYPKPRRHPAQFK